jgi:hypothetical protein
MNLPVSFSEKVKQPATQGGGGYPYQIKADDLDKNFVYAALDAEDGYIEETGGQGGHTGRKLLFPPFVAKSAVLILKEGEGRPLQWVEGDENPTILAFNKDGELVWIEKPDGGDPTILTFDKDGEIVWLEKPDGQAALIFNEDGEPEWLKPPSTGTAVLGSVDGAIQWLETEDCD